MPAAGAGARLIGVLLLATALWTVIRFPVWPWALGLGLALYGATLLRFPGAYLIAVPLLLPVLDLAPLSGRFFWDEFDVVLAVTLGVRLLLPLPIRQKGFPLQKAALWLLLASVLGKHSDWPMAAGAGGRECVFKLFEQLQRAARRQRLCLGGCGTLAHCA